MIEVCLRKTEVFPCSSQVVGYNHSNCHPDRSSATINLYDPSHSPMFISVTLPLEEWGFIFHKTVWDFISKHWTPKEKAQNSIKRSCLPEDPYHSEKMPTAKKTLTFLLSFVTSLGLLVVLCVVLPTQQWIRSTIAISDSSSNGSDHHLWASSGEEYSRIESWTCRTRQKFWR